MAAATACCGGDEESDAAVDSGVDADLDSGVDAGVSSPPIHVWRAETPPDCSANRSPPTSSRLPLSGPEIRWVVGRESAVIANLGHWDVPPPSRPSLFGPVLDGSGNVFWTFSNFIDVGLAHDDGVAVHFGSSSLGEARGNDALETHFPRLWLPSTNALYFANGWVRRPLRAPSYNINDAPSPAVGVAPNLPAYGESPHVYRVGHPGGWMPAWSPVTGDLVVVGGNDEVNATTGSDRLIVAGCDAGVRWVSRVPGDEGVLFVEANGNVIIGAAGRVSVLDGQTGETLRSVVIGTSGDFGNYGRAQSYHPSCGVLVRVSTATGTWYWLDSETLTPGPELRLDEGVPANTENWSGTEDCGLVVSGSRLQRFRADGTVRYARDFERARQEAFGDVGGITNASPPIALADGGTLFPTVPPGYFVVGPDGELQEVVNLADPRVGTMLEGDPLLGPDGSMYWLTSAGPGLPTAFAVSTGHVPGPMLWPQSGLNWARTNSYLP